MSQWQKLGATWVEHGEVTVYQLSGVLTNSSESYAFLDQFLERARKGHRRVVIDLEGVEAITSAGVGILAACFTSIQNVGGRLCLSRVPARARSILNVVGLLSMIGEESTEEAAARRVTS